MLFGENFSINYMPKSIINFKYRSDNKILFNLELKKNLKLNKNE